MKIINKYSFSNEEYISGHEKDNVEKVGTSLK